MLGEGISPTPAIRIPAWPGCDLRPGSGLSCGNGAGAGAGEFSPYLYGEGGGVKSILLLPTASEGYMSDEGGEESEAVDSPVDAYSCDEFRMYEFKVRRCPRGRSHDWTECPYAHPDEKARRRDPRKFHYSGTACPDFRKGSCKRGDACEFAHGVFECWLHPARYRTQPCKDGVNCRRRVCFFAHTPEQLRILPQTQQQQSPRTPAASDSYDDSPLRYHAFDTYVTQNMFSSSPGMTPPSDSPPPSPSGPPLRRVSLTMGSPVNEVLASLRQLQLSKAMSVPASCGLQVSGMGSPQGVTVRPGFCSLPATPMGGNGGGFLEVWDEPKERVESGRNLRAKLYEKLSKENFMGTPMEVYHDEAAAVVGPDVDWVSELLKWSGGPRTCLEPTSNLVRRATHTNSHDLCRLYILEGFQENLGCLNFGDSLASDVCKGLRWRLIHVSFVEEFAAEAVGSHSACT